MIVLDKDRGKPIHVRQSLFLPLIVTSTAGVIATIIALESAKSIGNKSAGDIWSIKSAIAMSIPVVIPMGFLFLLLVLLVSHRCFWSADVDGSVISYRSVFHDTEVSVADIVRVSNGRGRLTWSVLHVKDGTSILMFDVAVGCFGDMARFEDDILLKIPQLEMKRRLFDKIIRKGYTEYL
ncbi:hypothetical protein D3273_23215 [Lichenibacterium minor]|uniref:Uncharacterized protein n=1 Tax=Lichenibacterium minor TaxID=2316528 RepID=A0A4Q2U454_9HYPH|nr:hypothetical protein [Lichenibacterium minor]RYC29555.1 hypothetical protein D3273_23215 [Lichenibacterium minor]